jgi:hypothetical protein
MPRGFAENTSTKTRGIGERLSFDVDRLLGLIGNYAAWHQKKSRGKCIHVFALMPRGKSCSVWTLLYKWTIFRTIKIFTLNLLKKNIYIRTFLRVNFVNTDR